MCAETNTNTGEDNTGNRNSGYGNSGYGNSGNRNSGDWNSGYGNSGDRNSGYGNSGDRSSGIFCTKTPTLFLFDKPTDKTWGEITHPEFNEFFLTKWISESEMTDAEKVAEPQFHVRGGYLKTFSWKDAWANYWRDCDHNEKNRVINLPNFDAAIFKEITGIDTQEKKVSCAGKVIEVEGKKYKLIEV